MFTWICKTIGAGALALALTGCVTIPLGDGGAAGTASLTAGNIQIIGPRGFCLDPSATRDTGAAAFAIFGNCAALNDSRFSRQPATPAVLTAAVSEPSSSGGIADTLSSLSEFFGSSDGRQVLSRTGDPDTVNVLQSFVAGDVFFLRASDNSPGVAPGVQDTYWRAYFDIGPRIVTLSVLALDGEAVDEAAQLSILEQFVSDTRAANAGGGVVAPEPDAQAETASNGGGVFNSGFFRRIVGSGDG